jgi:hypothetical protein
MLLHEILTTLGALFVMGLAVDAAGRLTRMPRVTLLKLGIRAEERANVTAR